MKSKIALCFLLSCIGCAHTSPETVAIGASVGGVAGVGLGYLGMYAVNRAAFASALAEHREQLELQQHPRERDEPQPRPEPRRDTDSDGVPDSQDRCSNEPRGPRLEDANESERLRWHLGCPTVRRPVTGGGFSVGGGVGSTEQ